MRILLDESLPRQLAPELIGHEVTTVAERGRAGYENGALLRRAVADGFEAVGSEDRNIQYQQNIPSFAIRVVVIAARTNRMEDLPPLIPEALDALSMVQPGELREVGG